MREDDNGSTKLVNRGERRYRNPLALYRLLDSATPSRRRATASAHFTNGHPQSISEKALRGVATAIVTG